MTKKIAELGSRLSVMTEAPQPAIANHSPEERKPQAKEPPAADGRRQRLVEPTIRYAIDLPKTLHRRLKAWAVEEDTTNLAVTRALVTLLLEDDQVADRVRQLVHDDRP